MSGSPKQFELFSWAGNPGALLRCVFGVLSLDRLSLPLRSRKLPALPPMHSLGR